MEIEKFISYQIESQFPAIYRESGRELIALLEAYYDFLETDDRQSTYQSRRLFEYRDIDRTLESLLIYFSKKYLNGLPLDGENTPFIVKHILDFYRRKGTAEGLVTFFRLFYNEEVKVYYPSEAMLKVSESEWNQVTYIQMFPVDDLSIYEDIGGRKIYGTLSKAEATANKVLVMFLNKKVTPVIFLNNVKGSFVGFDNVISREGDMVKDYGRIYGSMDSVDIDNDFFDATTGNNVGDILTFEYTEERGGKLIVTDVSTNFTGQISYRILDGGFGYTKDTTELLVSNQIIFFDANNAPQIEPLEVLTDNFGNTGEVIGSRDYILGIRMAEGSEFVNNSIISDSSNNIISFDFVTEKNGTSPGPIITEAANNELEFAVQVDELSFVEEVSLITDVIGDFLNVSLDSLNYNDIPPALKAMSGNTDPITIDTALEDAFDLTPFEIGRIESFKNVDPGRDYTNEVFTIALDRVMFNFSRNDQVVTLGLDSSTLTTNSIISQILPSGKVIRGIVRDKIIYNDPTKPYVASLFVTSFSYYGFQDEYPIIFNNVQYDVLDVSRNYSSDIYGFNAKIRSDTEFAEGKILAVKVIESGFGYIDDRIENLYDKNGIIAARGRVNARGQGITEGIWTSNESHINGFLEDGIEYYDGGQRIQDSNYYQDYSYEVLSKVGINTYERTLKDLAHVAGTKLFGKFNLEDSVENDNRISMQIVLNYEEPIGSSGDLIGADTNQITADSTLITADNFKNYKYSSDDDSITADISNITADAT